MRTEEQPITKVFSKVLADGINSAIVLSFSSSFQGHITFQTYFKAFKLYYHQKQEPLMTQNDWIGFIGVSILVIAYFLNLKDIIKKESIIYLFSNLLGAGTACYASVILKYLPFVILEGCWTLVSAVGIFNYFYIRNE